MRVVGVLQARTGSRRYPGKVLAPIAGRPLLERLLERLRWSKRMDALAVATSTLPGDDSIEALCRGMGVTVHRGSESDVLQRMLDCAENLKADVVVRLAADNPLVDGVLVDRMLDEFLPRIPPLVYAQTVDGSGYPIGLSCEAITIEGLRIAAKSDDPFDREHVTAHVRYRGHLYPNVVAKSPRDFGHVSLTVDTPEDYGRVRELFETLYQRNVRFGPDDVLAELAHRAADESRQP